tara:strand:+ start:1105 stop:2457 length:1353 start_codon:yes stop_codon:yes gene_type:complete
MKGLGTSKGIVTGKVKVINSYEDHKNFQEEDILVTRITDPTMTQIMGKASGIICEIGGMTSHPSILSRELGIPCIVSVKNVLIELKDGDVVTIDGSSGEIIINPQKKEKENCKSKFKNENIKQFLKSYLITLGEMDTETYEPLNCFTYHPLFDKEWIEKITKVIELIEKNNISMKLVAKTFTNTSHQRAQLFFLLLDLKSANINKEKKIKLAEFFHKLLLLNSKDDPYGFKSNLPKKNYKKILEKDFKKANPEIAKKLGKLYTATYHLNNGLYTDFYTDYGVNVMGPYKIDETKELVIKEFCDSMPLLLWKYIFPFKKLRIYCIYENVKFSCDAISCHVNYEGDTINGLKEYLVEVDGRIVNENELDKLIEETEKVAIKQWEIFISMSKDEIKQKAVYIRNYINKDFFELAGIEWKSNKEMLDVVKKNETQFWKETSEEYWMNVLDPYQD